LRRYSRKEVVHLWGGFVPNCYKYPAKSTYVALFSNGEHIVSRTGSCNRSYGKGNSLHASGKSQKMNQYVSAVNCADGTFFIVKTRAYSAANAKNNIQAFLNAKELKEYSIGAVAIDENHKGTYLLK
jgi:hypothetical protein